MASVHSIKKFTGGDVFYAKLLFDPGLQNRIVYYPFLNRWIKYSSDKDESSDDDND